MNGERVANPYYVCLWLPVLLETPQRFIPISEIPMISKVFDICSEFWQNCFYDDKIICFLWQVSLWSNWSYLTVPFSIYPICLDITHLPYQEAILDIGRPVQMAPPRLTKRGLPGNTGDTLPTIPRRLAPTMLAGSNSQKDRSCVLQSTWGWYQTGIPEKLFRGRCTHLLCDCTANQHQPNR